MKTGAVCPTGVLLAMLLLGVDAAPAAAQQQPPAGWEEGIYAVVVPGLAPVSLPVLAGPAGELLLPLIPVLELTGTPFQIDGGGRRVRVSRPLGAGTRVLDATRGTVSGDTQRALGEGELAESGGGIHLAPAALGFLLDASAEVDPAALVV
ncbi:MAG: hypothetical protein M3409_03760, partial [Gemmatimonadota bacterium]|nr:hypothetical protein [Gemmatimonadota bacterium]